MIGAVPCGCDGCKARDADYAGDDRDDGDDDHNDVTVTWRWWLRDRYGDNGDGAVQTRRQCIATKKR